VLSLAFSRDGQRVLSSGADRREKSIQYFPQFQPADPPRVSESRIRLWDVSDGHEIRSLAGGAGRVRAVRFSADETRVLSASEDGTVRLWDAKTGGELGRFRGGEGRVDNCVFSPDARWLLASEDERVQLWDVERNQAVRSFERTGPLNLPLAISPDNHLLLENQDSVKNPDSARVLVLRDLETGQEVHRLQGHLSKSLCGAFLPDGRRGLSGGWDTTVRLWDVTSGKEARSFLGHLTQVRQLAVSPDGRYAVSGSNDGTVRLWELPQ
jgi:WD40 repeat protein